MVRYTSTPVRVEPPAPPVRSAGRATSDNVPLPTANAAEENERRSSSPLKVAKRLVETFTTISRIGGNTQVTFDSLHLLAAPSDALAATMCNKIVPDCNPSASLSHKNNQVQEEEEPHPSDERYREDFDRPVEYTQEEIERELADPPPFIAEKELTVRQVIEAQGRNFYKYGNFSGDRNTNRNPTPPSYSYQSKQRSGSQSSSNKNEPSTSASYNQRRTPNTYYNKAQAAAQNDAASSKVMSLLTAASKAMEREREGSDPSDFDLDTEYETDSSFPDSVPKKYRDKYKADPLEHVLWDDAKLPDNGEKRTYKERKTNRIAHQQKLWASNQEVFEKNEANQTKGANEAAQPSDGKNANSSTTSSNASGNNVTVQPSRTSYLRDAKEAEERKEIERRAARGASRNTSGRSRNMGQKTQNVISGLDVQAALDKARKAIEAKKAQEEAEKQKAASSAASNIKSTSSAASKQTHVTTRQSIGMENTGAGSSASSSAQKQVSRQSATPSETGRQSNSAASSDSGEPTPRRSIPRILAASKQARSSASKQTPTFATPAASQAKPTGNPPSSTLSSSAPTEKQAPAPVEAAKQKTPVPAAALKQEIVSPVAPSKPNTSTPVAAQKSTNATPVAASKQTNATPVTAAKPGSTKKTDSKPEKKETAAKPTSSTPTSTLGKRKTRNSEQTSQDAPRAMLDASEIKEEIEDEPSSSTRPAPPKKKRLTEGERLLNMDFGPKEGGTLGDMSVLWSDKRLRLSSSTPVPQSPTPQGPRNLPRRAAGKKTVVVLDDDEDEDEHEEEEDDDEEDIDETPVEPRTKERGESKQKEQPQQQQQQLQSQRQSVDEDNDAPPVLTPEANSAGEPMEEDGPEEVREETADNSPSHKKYQAAVFSIPPQLVAALKASRANASQMDTSPAPSPPKTQEPVEQQTVTSRNDVPGPAPAPTSQQQTHTLTLQQLQPNLYNHLRRQTPQPQSQQSTPAQPQDLYMPRAQPGTYRVFGPQGGQRDGNRSNNSPVDPSTNVKTYLKDTMTNIAHSAGPNRGRTAPQPVPYRVQIVTPDALRNQMLQQQQQAQRQQQHQQMQQQMHQKQQQIEQQRQQQELQRQQQAEQQRLQQQKLDQQFHQQSQSPLDFQRAQDQHRPFMQNPRERASTSRKKQSVPSHVPQYVPPQQQQQRPLLPHMLQSQPSTPPAPVMLRTGDNDVLIEPVPPKLFNSYGAETILPDGKTIDYKAWTKEDLANWVQKFLTSETGQKCGAIIIQEEWDGSLLENLLDESTRAALGLAHGAFLKLKNYVAAVLNTYNKTKYMQDKRAYDLKNL